MWNEDMNGDMIEEDDNNIDSDDETTIETEDK